MYREFYTYILSSTCRGTLYIGVSAQLVRRVWEHREGFGGGFSKRHGVKRLVYYESHGDAQAAFQREKRLKKWKRGWKIELIEQFNPEWRDLYEDIAG